jgi:DNA repair protein RecN (Recombination protein N)
MLRGLSIRNFVIVESLELEFEPGFSVLTGETGAGKSILIEALSLALGEKAPAEVIRMGAERAEVSATFEIEADSAAAHWLAEQGLDQGQELLLRRVLDRGGKSRGFINGAPATSTQLRELSQWLVDIHGQHAHQSLLKKSAQRELLDAWAKTEPLLVGVREAWHLWKTASRQWQEWRERAEEMVIEQERLRTDVAEMKALGITTEGWGELQAEHHRQSHAAELIATADRVHSLLSGDDASARQSLAQARLKLQEMVTLDPTLKAHSEMLDSALIQVDEVAHDISRYGQGLECDEAELTRLDGRISATLSLCRRLHITPEELEARQATDQARLNELDVLASGQELEKATAQAEAQWRSRAQALSQQRHEAAARLEQTVTRTLGELAFAQGGFKVRLEPLENGAAHGQDEVEFLISLHPSQPPQPLAQIASGGELSRISLAIQAALSGVASVPTLIFDEVDTGIGGRVAEIVGRLLAALGQKHQVMCVTHLPQVAARGHHHFTVTKQETPAGYTSHIAKLNPKARVDELSRMLGGLAITDTTRRHAAEMLEGLPSS